MHRGYVKVWRKMTESGLLTEHKALALFIYLLMNVTHKPIAPMVRGNRVPLQPGQFIAGRKQLASALAITERNARTALSLLEKAEIVTKEATKHYSVITVINWARYQTDEGVPDQKSDQEVTKNRPRGDQEVTTKQECKNVRSKEKSIGNSLRFVPPTLDDVTRYCRERMSTVDPEAFVAHYASNGWKVGKAPMKNWQAAIVTWEKKEVERRGEYRQGRRERISTSEIAAQMAREAYREELRGKESGFGDCDTNFPALPLLD